ncbi:hypothetical protein [Sphaerimonospora mesophila]|uniref:hypothetical protein n=1 Tax=Sphaerimonospora mesophila TaxID=37483 RepID=UPI000B32140F
MRIRIEGTNAEVAYTISKLRAILPIGQISPITPVGRRPHTWRVFVRTAPKRARRWTA